MTDTTTEMLALADRCGKCAFFTENVEARELLLEAANALRASAGAYVEGQRSMRERASQYAQERSISADSDISRRTYRRIASAIASLPLEAQESDGGVEGHAAVPPEIPTQRSGVSRDPLGDGSVKVGPHREDAAGIKPGPSDTPTSGDAEPTFGCKRAGGFVDSNCLALCDCDTTMRLALKPEAAPAGEVAWLRAAPEGDTVAFVACDENDDGAFAVYATPPAITDNLARIKPAIDNLTNHQEQCDRDGIMVKVSRQALDEVLSFIDGGDHD